MTTAPPPPTLVLTPQTNSRLLSLPAELRNRIFELTVRTNTWIDLPRNITGFQPLDQEQHDRVALPPITQVSRQIRQEALPLFFGLNFFVLDTRFSTSLCYATGKWLDAMDPHLRLLHKMTLQVAYCNGETHSEDQPISLTLRFSSSEQESSITSVDDYSALVIPQIRHHFHSRCVIYSILARMIDACTPASLFGSADHIRWLVSDLKRFYHHFQLDAMDIIPAERRPLLLNSLCGPEPEVERPPDMYTRDLENVFLHARAEGGEWEARMKARFSYSRVRMA